MRLLSFSANGAASYGSTDGTNIRDIGKVLGDAYPTLASTLHDPALLKEAEPKADTLAIADATLLPVIPDPRRIFCIGINYATHIAETGRPTPEKPVVFMRSPDSQVGAGQPMLRPAESEQFDFEGELAVVIGREGRRIARKDALDHVAGYSCYNDGTIRDWQRHTSQFAPGKNFWRSGSFGPWLVTRDEIPDPSDLWLTSRLNGELMQETSTGDMVFGVAELIEYCSTFTPLRAGDVIATGTTGGVGAFRKPPVWMKDGDTIEIEISKIGTLTNPVRDDSGFPPL